MASGSTITPLMVAAATGLLQNQGLNLNSALNTQVLTYTRDYEVPSSEISVGFTGNLVSDGWRVYDEFYVYSQGHDSSGNVVTVATLVRNDLGDLQTLVPNGWAIDGTIYNGSLSGFGGHVAERISSGYAPAFISNIDATGNITITNNTPTYDGRYDTYYGNPALQDLGRDYIPAITQVMPRSVTDISGSLKYWMDLSINRPIGSTTDKNIQHMIMVVGRMLGWIVNANRYLDAARTAESTYFPDYGVKNYQDFITQGWLKYQTGQALTTAFDNVGTMTDAIYTGNFGTPGGVTYVLLGRGLGSVGNLSAKLTQQSVNSNDVMNPIYTDTLTRILSEINNPDDLKTIQETIESTVPNMASALAYTDIGACAGLRNDSEFTTFAQVGVDLYNKSPYISVNSGKDIANIIRNIQSPQSARVEAVASSTSILKPEIVQTLRNLMPKNPSNGRITLLDVIGSPSGYYAGNLKAVNEGIAQLDATSYGPVIRQALQNIVSPTNLIDPDGNPSNDVPAQSVQDYNDLMHSIVNDQTGSIQAIVNKINSNYEYICQHVATEVYNWTKANIEIRLYPDNTAIMSFATGLPSYATDSQSVKSNEYISGLVEDNQTGDIITSILAEAKNYALIQNYGITPNGYIG